MMNPNIKPWENAPSGAPLYIPSPTVEDFIFSICGGPANEFRLLMLLGSRGEGKTVAAIMALRALGERLEREGRKDLLPVRVACVRDTWTNLSRTTLVSFEELQRMGLPVEWSDGRHEARVGRWTHYSFFGLDTRQDSDKLQGFTCGVLWLEEVAPAAELAVGIPPESLAIGITSIRQAGIPKRVIMTMNPPDEDHWALNVEKTLAESGQRDIIVVRFNIPPGEKSAHFERMAQLAESMGDTERARQWRSSSAEFDAYRRRNRLALESIGRHDLVQRLVEGKVGGVALGESIVPEFSEEHVIHTPPTLIEGSQYVRCWDAGLTPSTVWMQITPAGNIDVLGSRTSINKAMGDHIVDEVAKFQDTWKLWPPRGTRGGGFGAGARGGLTFRDIGDPNCAKGSEGLRSEDTAMRAIENLLGTTFEPGPAPWSARRDALHIAFHRKGTGNRALIQIYDKENVELLKGLRGYAHYPVDPATGRINPSIEAAKRVSGVYLQALDALAYGLAVLFPAEDWLKRPSRPSRSSRRPPATWMGG